MHPAPFPYVPHHHVVTGGAQGVPFAPSVRPYSLWTVLEGIGLRGVLCATCARGGVKPLDGGPEVWAGGLEETSPRALILMSFMSFWANLRLEAFLEYLVLVGG
jgi:hypothetical protein